MSLTEHGDSYFFMSKEEKIQHHKKAYYKVLVPFLLLALGAIVSTIGFTSSTELTLRYALLFAPVFSMCVNVFWFNLINRYNDSKAKLRRIRSKAKLFLPPSNALFFIITIILPAISFLAMIPISLKVTLQMPDFQIVAFGDAIFFFLCLMGNVLSYTKLKRWK